MEKPIVADKAKASRKTSNIQAHIVDTTVPREHKLDR
jgi:hypothetical protein